MTLPFERTNAVKRTERFLMDLLDPKKTPRIPKQIRREAGSLLKHFPSRFDMEVVSAREEKNKDGKLYQVFGENTFKGEKVKVTMIDPPSGWKYGFPKVLPKQFDTWEEQREWLVSEGYPQKEIDSYGNSFYCRYWEQEIE